jgi:hypothetical protein
MYAEKTVLGIGQYRPMPSTVFSEAIPQLGLNGYPRHRLILPQAGHTNNFPRDLPVSGRTEEDDG